jgi:ATP-dependent DNA helicase DinG
MQESLKTLHEWLQAIADRGKGLESCGQRATLLKDRLALLMEHESGDHIHWFETFNTSFRLNLTPLNVAPVFRNCIDNLSSAWVFTSATLAVGDSFEHFSAQLGLDDAQTLQLDSPFDYRNNALLYLPADMPEPHERHYTDAVVQVAREVLSASGGRAFLLFTSHSALRAAARLLEQGFDYPLLVQGSAPRSELLEQFRALGNAVLLGTSSFWEGVDVRGEALSCVIIDKLPFGSPGDPVLQARIEALRKQGVNPFMAYQLPTAVITLKQGVGRLIRDHMDRGVLVLCDPRLRSKSYGRVFLDSLPDIPRTQDVDDVREFFASAQAYGPAP